MTVKTMHGDVLPYDANAAPARALTSGYLKNRVTRPLAATVIAVGIVVLIGWAFKIQFLTHVIARLELMKANTAVGLALGGMSLWLLTGRRARDTANWPARALALAMGVIGLATLVEYFSGLSLHIDQILFADPVAPGRYAGRMAPSTALAFVLLSFSLFALDVRSPTMWLVGDCAALSGGMLGELALVGYLYGDNYFSQLGGVFSMAVHSSIALVALMVGAVLAREGSEINRVLLLAEPAGGVTRRLLGFALLTIVVAGGLALYGQHLEHFGVAFALAILVVVAITVLSGILFWSAQLIRRFSLAEKNALETANNIGERYARLVANVPGGVFTRKLSAAGVLTFPYLSPQYREMFGIDPQAAVDDGKAVVAHIHPGDRDDYVASLHEFAEALLPWLREYRIVLPRGDVRWIRSQGKPHRTVAGETVWDGIAFDVTDSKLRDEQFLQSQKMEALGKLTGGIAHDFNNLLTVILGNAELLAEAVAGNAKQKRLAGFVSTAAQRAAELIASLLAFSRQQPLQAKVTDIDELVIRLHGLLGRALGEHVAVRLVHGEGLWPAMVDAAQLEAALLNLAVNARDAMPRGGTLTIATANRELDRDYAQLNEAVVPGRYVMVSVSDTGIGMTAEVQRKAFDPFFTTKEVGKGTGLGLSMVFGFVKQSKGHIKLYSEVGHGTTVQLYLPRATEVEEKSAAVIEMAEPRGRDEIVLLAEDDDMVRAYVEEQIRGLGYRVHPTGTGAEALDILRRGEPVDLLLTDVVMPGGINGAELAREAQRIRPDLRVIFTSGYSENVIVHQGKIDRGIDLLSKPYRRRDLAAILRTVLDRPRPAGAESA